MGVNDADDYPDICIGSHCLHYDVDRAVDYCCQCEETEEQA